MTKRLRNQGPKPTLSGVSTKIDKTLDQIKKLLANFAMELQRSKEVTKNAFEKLSYDLSVSDVAVEMNFWVPLKLAQAGHLDPNSEAMKDSEVLLRLIKTTQDEYLAVLAVCNAFNHLGTTKI